MIERLVRAQHQVGASLTRVGWIEDRDAETCGDLDCRIPMRDLHGANRGLEAFNDEANGLLVALGQQR